MGSLSEISSTSNSSTNEEKGGVGGESSYLCENLSFEPISTFEELMKYGEADCEGNFSRLVNDVCRSNLVPLLDKSFGKKKISFSGKSLGEKHPLTLVCHDLKGGYGDDRFANGASDFKNYTYRHWMLTDIFVYFAHKFVTIPPISWINAAHLHGVKILGTIITEWDEGHALCNKFLESEESISKTVQKLCKICEDFGFEGYLLNIENKLDGEGQTKIMVEFTKKLTEGLKKISPKNLVIWYDSVIENGELKWQDELNDKNKIFFDVCDGIFLNYNWSEDKLKNSINLAGGERRYDIFAGVDCWGRGCWGGGGMNTCLAVEKIAANDLSIAFFAPGWTYEAHDFQQYPFIDDELWTKCMKNLHTRCLVQSYVPPTCRTGAGARARAISGSGNEKDNGAKPKSCDKSSSRSSSDIDKSKTFQIFFATDFSRGYGTKLFSFGKVISDESWFDLSKQSFQPVIFSSIKCLEYDCKEDQAKYLSLLAKTKKQDIKPSNAMVCSDPKVIYDMDNGFSGGGSLKLLNSKKRKDFEDPLTSSPIWIPMDIPISASRLTLAVIAIWKSVSIVHHQIKIYLELGKDGSPNRKVLLGDLDSLATSVRGKFYISLKLSDFLHGFDNLDGSSGDLEFYFQKNNYDEKDLNGWRVSCFLFDIDQVYDQYSSIKSLRAGADGDISLGFLSLGQITHYVH